MSRPTELGHYPFVVIDRDAGERTPVDHALLIGGIELGVDHALLHPEDYTVVQQILEVRADALLERDDPQGPALLAMLRGWPYTVVSVEPRDFECVTDPCLTLMHHNVSWSVTSATPDNPRWVEDLLRLLLGSPAHAEQWQAELVDVMTASERLRWEVTPKRVHLEAPYDFFDVWLMVNAARRDMLVMQPYPQARPGDPDYANDLAWVLPGGMR